MYIVFTYLLTDSALGEGLPMTGIPNDRDIFCLSFSLLFPFLSPIDCSILDLVNLSLDSMEVFSVIKVRYYYQLYIHITHIRNNRAGGFNRLLTYLH